MLLRQLQAIDAQLYLINRQVTVWAGELMGKKALKYVVHANSASADTAFIHRDHLQVPLQSLQFCWLLTLLQGIPCRCSVIHFIVPDVVLCCPVARPPENSWAAEHNDSDVAVSSIQCLLQ